MRKYADEDGRLFLAEGEYGQQNGKWYARPPGMHMACIDRHTVTEHEDGTITVSPSILISYTYAGKKIEWHGYLERGEWREV